MAHAHLVVVNDDPSFIAAMRDALQAEGFEVRGYRAGASAFAAIRTHPPMLICLDLYIGDATGGWRLLERLWQDPVTRPIPLIIATGDGRTVRQRARDLARHNYRLLEKPFGLDALRAVVRDALGASPQTPARPSVTGQAGAAP